MRRQRGFTLVEMLVTLSVFGLALATLLGVLRVGADSKERVEAFLEENFELHWAMGQMREDIMASVLEEDNPALEFFSGKEESELLSFFRLSGNEDGPALLHVRYVLEPRPGTEPASFRMLRRAAPVVTDTPIPPYSEQVLLDQVADVSIEYSSNSDWQQKWESPGTLPQRVRVTGFIGKSDTRTPFRLTVAVPASEYFGDRDGH